MVSIIGHAERNPIMPVTLPHSVKKLLQDKAYGHVLTFNAQGKPQLTMVWMDVDGDEVTFNTAEGRNKPQNLRRDPRIIVSVQDRNDPRPTRSSTARPGSRRRAPTITSTSSPSDF